MIISFKKTVDLLCSELANMSVEEVIAVINSTTFTELHRCNDWRNYVSQAQWGKTSLEEQIVDVVLAMQQAGAEEWD